MITEVKEWVSSNQAVVWWLASFSVATLLVSLIVVPIVVARMRADYFVAEPDETERSLKKRHPVLRILGLILKNGVGGLLVIFGLVLSVPGVFGQGFLTILIGLLIMDFPGKKRFELWIIKRKPVRKAIEWMREKAGREPLMIPDS